MQSGYQKYMDFSSISLSGMSHLDRLAPSSGPSPLAIAAATQAKLQSNRADSALQRHGRINGGYDLSNATKDKKHVRTDVKRMHPENLEGPDGWMLAI